MLTPGELDAMSPLSESVAREVEAEMLAVMAREVARASDGGLESAATGAVAVSAGVREVSKRLRSRLHEALRRDLEAAITKSGERDAADAESAAGGDTWPQATVTTLRG